MIETIKNAIFGDKIGNSETRHRPAWFPPSEFDKRWLGERFAILSIPPYKPPYRRHFRLKAWVCFGPRYLVSKTAIIEVDMDNRDISLEVYE